MTKKGKLPRVSRTIKTVGELGPLIRRIGTTLLQSKVVLFAQQSGSNCANVQILSDNWNHFVGQLEPTCRKIGTTLWENWNHLVIQMKTLAGETSSCLGEKVESQESRVKNQESRVKSQESRVKSQESRIKSQKSR